MVQLSKTPVKPAKATKETNLQKEQHLSSGKTPMPVTIQRRDLTPQDETNIIGSGTYGVCYKGFYHGNIPVVIKSFRKSIQRHEVQRESEALQDLQRTQHHISLPLLFGVNLDSLSFLLVTQLNGAQDRTYALGNAIKEKLLKFKQWVDLAIQLARTLGYIQSCGWLHNDLKENNIVVHYISPAWNPVIIDFGKSCLIKKAKVKTKQHDASRYPWIAPEVLQYTSPPSQASDIFSFGMILKLL
ncbi:tyrosine-protein kinase Src42A-like [Exaiptasia diaphana]|uniref:Protein kinase domain-containing protein n=1 Tax=Exaiptasia diaphana TaxID=2652724 RepID=A0A913WYE3_EXADI|nr:tyrosine-protein kinase Src42A-like [Exaiptasia diaphana]